MNCKRTLGRLALALAVAATAASASFAAEYSLTAGATTVVIAGQNVPVWGFACTATTVAGACPSLGTVTVPGPRLVVPAGEDLIVNLTNNLPEGVSIVLPGEALPTVTGGSVPAGTMTDPQGRTRATSFIAQAPPGGSATFTWTGLRPGTFLYQSGSHVTLQAHMGLYGAVTKNAVEAAPPAKAQAYAGVEYDNEVVMFYSEVDAVLHATATPANAINYDPRYFLVNGKPYEAGDPALPAGDANEKTLIRFLNAGLKAHVPVVQNAYWSVVAEDGSKYPYPRAQYNVYLAPGKTSDVIFQPSVAGTYPVYDRRLHLTTGGAGGGGLLAHLEVLSPTGGPTAANDGYNATEDTLLAVAAPGVLGNDTPATGLTAVLASPTTAGVVALAGDGSFTYTPNPNFNGTDSFTYQATDGVQTSAPATVQLIVAPTADAPVATADAFTALSGTDLVIAAPGVLANDSDADGDPLTALLVSGPTNGGTLTWGANDGSFTYNRENGGATQVVDTFTYKANDGGLDSNTVTVTVTVDPNHPPVAVDDFATRARNGTINDFSIVANDTDEDGTINPASVVLTGQAVLPGDPRPRVTTSLGGTAFNNGDGTIDYASAINVRGTDTFTYTVRDNDGAISNTATMRINIVRRIQ